MAAYSKNCQYIYFRKTNSQNKNIVIHWHIGKKPTVLVVKERRSRASKVFSLVQSYYGLHFLLKTRTIFVYSTTFFNYIKGPLFELLFLQCALSRKRQKGPPICRSFLTFPRERTVEGKHCSIHISSNNIEGFWRIFSRLLYIKPHRCL